MGRWIRGWLERVKAQLVQNIQLHPSLSWQQHRELRVSFRHVWSWYWVHLISSSVATRIRRHEDYENWRTLEKAICIRPPNSTIPSRCWRVHQPCYHLLSPLNRQIWQQSSREGEGSQGMALSQFTQTNTTPLWAGHAGSRLNVRLLTHHSQSRAPQAEAGGGGLPRHLQSN